MMYLRISEKDNKGCRKVWFNLDAKHETYITVGDSATFENVMTCIDLVKRQAIINGITEMKKRGDLK